MLGGDGGSGKSQVALQLAVAAVTATPFFERPVRRGPAVVIAAEDDAQEIRRRLIATCADANVTIGDLDDLHIITLAGEDALLAVPDGRANAMSATDLFSVLCEEIGEINPVLIVIDTLADVFGGHELDRGQARSFITMLRGGLCDGGAAVLLLAHPSLAGIKDGRAAAGSTGWTNSVRASLALKVDEKTGLRTLEVRKSNYGPTGQRISMRWREGAFALAAAGDVPTKFQHQSEKNADQADTKVRLLSDALPANLTVDDILPVLRKQGFLERTDPKNHTRTARYWIKNVADFRARKNGRKSDRDEG